MDDETKHYLILSVILLIISALLLMLFLPPVILWDTSSDRFLWDILGLLWPVIGISAAFEFLRSERDKWGWGGIMFHFFIWYSMGYYLYLVIAAIINFTIVATFFIYLAICILGWFGYLYYYD